MARQAFGDNKTWIQLKKSWRPNLSWRSSCTDEKDQAHATAEKRKSPFSIQEQTDVLSTDLLDDEAGDV